MQPTGILETVLYAEDLEAAEAFYTEVFGLEVFIREESRHLFFKVGNGMLLIFNPESTAHVPTQVKGQPIPVHGAEGVGHMAFRAPEWQMDAWKAHFRQLSVPIESEVHWPQGGRSLYVSDPAGNCVEVASPNIWGFGE
jgi:catechol 2,3-dioxygenase-like lactoylglutathione lyase family enzyme